MADNIYLLETRLSKAQQAALSLVREVAKAKGLTVFLVGGAVRDLIGGTAVRDLDVVVQGNALKIRKDIEKAGGVFAGEMEAGQAFFVRFPGGVRMEIGSTLTVHYPKPGKAVVKPANILEDLRRRDFTANAMALSLNDGSYGLLMDPTNGVADIENRELRLVSNYGFIEDPVRMIRAARLMARLGWGMEEKTRSRYETGKAEGYISAMDEFHRGYETEEIFHEEDALRVMRRLEEEGWMQHLSPALSSAKVNVAELERLRESQAQLQIQGVVADAAAANFPYLTAKLTAKECEALKKSFPRPGFVEEIEGLEAKGKEFAARLGAKGAALPSQAYMLLTSSDPEAVLWVAHTTKSAALQAKFKSFYAEWPQARQRIPYLLMQEMRIHPDLADYDVLVEKLFLELMDGKLGTLEEMKSFLEPFSPPAPPPPVSLRRPRAPKKDAKPAKSRKKAIEAEEDAGINGDGDAAEAEEEGDESLPAATGVVLESVPEGATKAAKVSRNGAGGSKAEAVLAGAANGADLRGPTSGGALDKKSAAQAKGAPALPGAAHSPVAKGLKVEAAAASAPANKGTKSGEKPVAKVSSGAAERGTSRTGHKPQATAVKRGAVKASAAKKEAPVKLPAAKKAVASKAVKATAKPVRKAVKAVAKKVVSKSRSGATAKTAAKKSAVKSGAKKAAAHAPAKAAKKAAVKGRR